MSSDPDPSPAAPSEPVHLPPPGGRTGRLALAAAILVLGLFQTAVGIQVERTATTVIGALVLVVGVSLLRRRDRGAVIGRGGVSVPGWPRGADVPWSQVTRLVEQRLPFGVVRLRMARADHPTGVTRPVATLTAGAAAQLLPAVRALAAAHEVPVVDRRGRARA